MLLIISHINQFSLIFKQDVELHIHMILIRMEYRIIKVTKALLILHDDLELGEFGAFRENLMFLREVQENFPLIFVFKFLIVFYNKNFILLFCGLANKINQLR